MKGWGRVKVGAQYAGISERTFRDWLKLGLQHSRLPSGTILIRYSAIDEFLENFSTEDNQADVIVEKVMKDFG